MYKFFLVLFLVAAVAVVDIGCASAPPASPASAAMRAVDVIAALDLLRDTAIAMNDQTPKILSTDDTRQIVLAHQSALKVVREAPAGWQALVVSLMTELLGRLDPETSSRITPYIGLVQFVIGGVR